MDDRPATRPGDRRSAIGDRFERRWIIVSGAATVVLASGLFAVTASPALLILLAIVLTVAGNTISFAYHTCEAKIFPRRIRARAIGFVYAFSRISAMYQGGVAGVFGVIGAAYMIVIVAIGVFGPATANRALEDIAA